MQHYTLRHLSLGLPLDEFICFCELDASNLDEVGAHESLPDLLLPTRCRH
jgi:hypothetical protein